jgi:tRNA-dihydrouridine synthase B
MAGVSDRPYRRLARIHGAALAVSEMISANPALRHSSESLRRIDHSGETGPISIQLLGADPLQMAEAAKFNVDRGANIIDINMGCPSKKVCNRRVGSALLRHEILVGQILDAVVSAVDVPVTLKIRTGWDPNQRNGVRIAKIAESAGVSALSVHGRTRQCRFHGPVEYQTIKQIKREVGIPVIANGDIDSPQKAKRVLEYTQADGIMIGRAAQGQPWLFGRIAHYLNCGIDPGDPHPISKRDTLLTHLSELYLLYGNVNGVRIARKHVSWYTSAIGNVQVFRRRFNLIDKPEEQIEFVRRHLISPEG